MMESVLRTARSLADSFLPEALTKREGDWLKGFDGGASTKTEGVEDTYNLAAASPTNGAW